MQGAETAEDRSQSLPGMPVSAMGISDREFRLIRNLIYERFGINITPEKRALLVGRLGKLLRKQGFASFHDYYRYLLADRTGGALDSLVNRISTNFTFFYREKDHFEFFLSPVLPEMVRRIRGEKGVHGKDLRVWCAGCSTGQEPYTLQILIREYLGKSYDDWEAGILATDISAKALETAVRGVYPEEALEKLPGPLKRRYFRKAGDGEYGVTDDIRRDITFRRFNLMNERFPFRRPFHVIFCRNVMIYFDQPTRDALIRRFHESMVTGGYLFIGHSETLGRKQTFFEYVKPAVYRKIEKGS